MKIPLTPFKILALAPFLGRHCLLLDKMPLRIDPANLDQVIEELGPTCRVSIPRDLHPEGTLEIKFKRLKDFHPDGLVRNHPVLRNLWEAKMWVDEGKKKKLSPQEINAHLANWPNLPPIRTETVPEKARATSRDPLDKILNMVALPDEHTGLPSEAQGATNSINTILKQVLKHIFLQETFRTLEASWRGLNLLLRQAKLRNNDVKIDIVPVSYDSLGETLSALTAEVIDALPSLILVDLGFDNSPRSLDLLESVAQFAETLLVPVITWIQPAFFYMDSWQDIKKLSFLPHYLEEPTFANWQSLKRAPSARWLAVTCNRCLSRYPYGNDNRPRLIQFEEQNPLWISPVWALGSLIGQSFIKTGWPTRFTDWQNMRLEDLPLNTEEAKKSLPIEANFDRNRIDQFIRSGIIPLAAVQGKDIAFVPNENTVGGVSLSYQLLVSRITQLVLWCRDHFEKGLKGSDLEAELGKAFSLLLESSGHSDPESLEIRTGKPDSDGRIPIRISLEPSREILPSRKRVELNFMW
jgi:type VI secretion system protein ImpC